MIDNNNNKVYLSKNNSLLFKKILEDNKTFYTNAVLHDMRFIADENTHLTSFMAVPIVVKAKVIGAIIVEDKKEDKRYTNENLNLLSNISSQLGASISNLKLHELAAIDGLTRVYTHRFFQIKLKEEINKGDTSLIIADIDYFKKVNDNFGHQEGDVVLKSVAKTISDHIDTKGITCRYGGEEFAIILPGIKKNEACEIAENIRKKIQQNIFVLKNQKALITASFGVAFTEKSKNHPRELIEEADQELYRAKHEGRNRVCWKE